MSKLVFAMATVMALACLPTVAQADNITGNDLWNLCSKDGYARGFCYGYVTALAEAVHCLPIDSTREQIVDIVKRFLEQHPEGRHYPATVLIASALVQAFPQAFPCKK